ncbi:MAG: NAD(P)H-binding protein [Dehalococcoidia bacterium]|nr:NAD(P)H-binding protein [Dehalococcoidia bacterium]
MQVLVAGGAGLLGGAALEALLEQGHEVSVLSRSSVSDPRVRSIRGDVTQPESLQGKLEGHDAVVDAVQFPNSPIENPKKGLTFERVDYGGTRNLVDAAKAAGIPHFIGISGAGAAPDAEFHWLRFKWHEEQYIKENAPGYTIFRGSWVYGPADQSLNRFLSFARFLPFVPVIGDGKTRLNPLFVNDLGRHVAAAVTNDRARDRLFEIGGPEILTMDEIIRTALRVAGKRRFLLHQPTWLMKAVASVAQHLPGRPLTPGAIDFITMDPTSDTTELREVFGLPLTPLAAGLATYLPKGSASGAPPT